jgi:hypothetical protein
MAIAQIMSLWSRIEFQQTLLLTTILGDRGAPVGVRMYQSLTGTAAQNNVLEAAFTAYGLPQRDEFRDLLQVLKKRARERNAVVHSMWGVSEQYPDSLIAVPTDALALSVADEAWTRSVLKDQGLQIIPGQTPPLVPGSMIYDLRDFKAIARRMVEALSAIEALRAAVIAHRREAHEKLLAQGQRPPAPPPSPLGQETTAE